MELRLLIKGFIIGFTIAASIGPIGILCIRRSLANGFASGLSSGLGAATADGFFGSIAAFGITFISSFLIAQHTWLQIIGVIFLVYLGVKILNEKPTGMQKGEVTSKGLLSDYLSILFLTIVNPMTILMFAAVFAGLGVDEVTKNYFSSSILTFGVFAGSASLYFLLSVVFGLFGRKLTSNLVLVVNRLSGTIIITFAVVTFAALLKAIIMV